MDGELLQQFWGWGCMQQVLVIALEPKETRRKIVISGTKNGLGIRIVGGRSAKQSASDNFGIFIKEVIRGSLAERDGKFVHSQCWSSFIGSLGVCRESQER